MSATPDLPTPPALHPITRERHGLRRWQRPPHYLHAAAQPLAPLAGFEAPIAAIRMPLAFVLQAGRPVLVAVLGVPPASNWCVAADGSWTGPYIPALFRAAPFNLHRTPEGKLLLCIDEAAGQVALADSAPGGEPFFSPEGAPVPLLQEVYAFLARLDQGRQNMERGCDALAEHRLLVPWQVVFQTPAGEQPMPGLLRVDEAALRNLPGDALHALMQAGALALAYSQLLSMQNIALLAEWSRAHAAQSPPPAPDLGLVQNLFDPAQPDTIKFNW